jgi:hypothetical protein
MVERSDVGARMTRRQRADRARRYRPEPRHQIRRHQRQRHGKGRVGTSASLRAFPTSSRNDRYLRSPDGWSRRKPVISDRVGGCRSWGTAARSSGATDNVGAASAVCLMTDEHDLQRSEHRAAWCRRASSRCQARCGPSVLFLVLRLCRFPAVRSGQLSVRVRPTREAVGQIVDHRR